MSEIDLPKPTQIPAERAEALELYKLMVEMADRISQRRQAANNFYLSINTLLVGGSAYLGALTLKYENVFLISAAGILVCAYWVKAIESYKTLNAAKFTVINSLEDKFVAKPYSQEWSILDPDGDGIRHKPFHHVEKAVPKIFIAIYALQIASLVPFRRWLEKGCAILS